MYDARSTDQLDMFWRGARQLASAGTAHVSGLDISIASDEKRIVLELDAGEITIDGQPVSVPADSVVLDNGPTTAEYRVDAISADANGNLQIEKGQPAEPAPTTDGTAYSNGGTPYSFRQLWNPAEPDVGAVVGCPLYTVVVPEDATASDDLAQEDIRDYRLAASDPGPHDHPDFALNRRTEYLFNGSADEYVKLATINDGTGTGRGETRIVGWRGNKRGNKQTRAFAVSVVTGGSLYDVSAYAYGSRAGATDVVVTEEAASNAGTTENRYHLYAYLPSGAGTYAVMSHTDGQFGGYQYTDGLAENDLLGSVVWDTGGSTGGPGGETQLPKAAAAVRNDVEGTTDVTDLVSGASGAAGNVPIARSDGTTAWANRVPNSGEWRALPSVQFPHDGSGYSTDAGSFTAVTSATEGVIVPWAQIGADRFDTFGVSLSAVLETDTDGDSVAARLAINTVGGEITGSAISNDTTAQTPLTSPRTTIDRSGTDRVYLEMQTESTNVGTAYMPTVYLWGRIA